MSDILFDCPHCDQSIQVDSSGAGMRVACPTCKTEIEIPAGQPAREESVDTGLEESLNETYGEESPRIPEQHPLGIGIPTENLESRSHERFRQLLEETARNIVPQLEAASAGIKMALE